MRSLPALMLTIVALLLPQAAMAQVAVADSGDTAWMMVCALFVLIAAIPGLALRHAGQVNVRNTLSVMAQGAGIAAGVSLVWAIVGYSLAYAPAGPWLGGRANLMLAGLGELREGLTVPESAFVLFQMSLAIFAASLIAGALAERARLGWMLAFAPLWLLLVYAPVAHWTWGGGWLADLGVMDFSGALVIHVCAGFSALALVLIAGRRHERPEAGHSPVLTIAGTGLIWIGWFGIIGGWALGATDDAASAIINCQLAACASALIWGLLDHVFTGRSKATGFASGAMAGLVAISASAGLVGAGGAMLIGVIAAVVCRTAAAFFSGGKLDDAGQIFAIHGIGGVVGMLLLVPFTLPLMGGVGFDGSISATSLALTQLTGIAVVALWSTIGAAIVGIAISVLMPLRVTADDEADGLDASQHGQQAWDFR